MPKVWSEVPGIRVREILADAGMFIWVGAWTTLAWRLYAFLSGFARAGRSIREGGTSLNAAGEQIGDALGRTPVIGHRMAELIRLAFSSASERFLEFGGTLERVIVIIAALLSLVVLVMALNLWFQRYLPWRLERLRTIGAAHRAIRLASRAADLELERLLASRALHRLSYRELLAHTPDPFGDWASGRYDRLAKAELASAGLQPSSGRRRSAGDH
jgi:hypothetical protein